MNILKGGSGCHYEGVNCVIFKENFKKCHMGQDFSVIKMKCHFRFPPTYVNLIIKQILYIRNNNGVLDEWVWVCVCMHV